MGAVGKGRPDRAMRKRLGFLQGVRGVLMTAKGSEVAVGGLPENGLR
jgi:hypothetical protein